MLQGIAYKKRNPSKETKERQANERNQQRRFPYHRVPISRNWHEEFAREVCAKNPWKEPTALCVLVVTRNHRRRDSCKEATTTRNSNGNSYKALHTRKENQQRNQRKTSKQRKPTITVPIS